MRKPPLLIQSLLLIAVSCLVAGDSQAQLYFKAKTLTMADGLSDQKVKCFYKDSKGFMWIGTSNGLNRYDGHSFKVFRPSSSNSISNEVINDIAEDKQGRLWVATMEGLNYYDPVTDHWDSFMPDPDTNYNEIPNYIVWDIWFDKNDLLWIASDVFEFSSYDYRKNKFTTYAWPRWARANLNTPGSGRYNSIQKFVQRNDHEFWLGTTKGLVSLDISTEKFSFIGGGYYSNVVDIGYDHTNRKVFLSAEKGLLFMYDEGLQQYKEMIVKKEPYPSEYFSFPGNDELWFASQHGLLKIGSDRSQAYLASHIPQLSGSLLAGGVQSVFEDDTHIRWLGTSNGLMAFDPGSRLSAFLPLLPVSDKESDNLMTCAYFDSLSNSYFVCSNTPAIVFIINATTGKISRIAADASGKPLSDCYVIKADNDNNIWLLTQKYVYRFDRATQQFHLFPTPNKDERASFRDMAQDQEGNYWFGSFHKGLYFYWVKEKRFTSLPDTNCQHLTSVTSLVSDLPNKQVLIGTFGEGTFVYNLSNDSLTGYFETRKIPQYAPLVLVHDAEMAPDGRIWVGTHSGGLFRFDHRLPYDKRFKQFNMRGGLSSNLVISLYSDGGPTIWMLSASGLSAIDTSGRFLYNIVGDEIFTFSSFASDNVFPHDIYFNSGKKELLAAVSGGLLFYSPAFNKKPISFPLVITGIKAGGTEVSEQDRLSPSLHRIPFRSNTVSFEFAGLYYGGLPGIFYEYRLDGYDKDWISAGKTYTAVYQNLPSGNYRFYVRARDGNGNIAGEVSGYSFRIVPPFWQTWWFKTLMALVVAMGMWWFIYSLRKKLQAEKQLNHFATSLYGQNTIDDILWDTARNCVQHLGFQDCVVYQVDEDRGMLMQRAAFGPKNPHRREILNVIEIQLGKGIVGSVAKSGRAEIIGNTSKDPRYIIDDEKRLSEITVPVFIDGKVFAVIDSEHPKKNFYNRNHLWILKKIAAICSERISKYLTEERLRTKIARDLHDEMGSTLTSINIISKVAMQGNMQDAQVKSYLQKIKDNSGRMMESMSDIVWAINPANDNFEKVILRMKEFAAEILEPARINYYFKEEGSLDKAQLNLEQRKDIYMVFKEAVNNAVKYSEATEVNIVLQKKDDSLKMVIIDNGNGFDTSTVYSGNGLKNMQSRANEMNAELRVDSIKGTGTTIILEVAIT